MKILKEGDMALNWTAEVDCHRCNGQLEVEEADVRWAYDYRDNGSHPMFDTYISEIRVDCPMCGTTLKVCSPYELSPLMQARLEKRQTTK